MESKKGGAKARSQTKGKQGGTAQKQGGRGANVTIDHDEIREWVEARGGFPATVSGTERKAEGAGLLRIDYPGFSGKGTLERIEWDEFFEKFEESKLAFLFDDKKRSRFSKFVAREGKRF